MSMSRNRIQAGGALSCSYSYSCSCSYSDPCCESCWRAELKYEQEQEHEQESDSVRGRFVILVLVESKSVFRREGREEREGKKHSMFWSAETIDLR